MEKSSTSSTISSEASNSHRLNLLSKYLAHLLLLSRESLTTYRHRSFSFFPRSSNVLSPISCLETSFLMHLPVRRLAFLATISDHTTLTAPHQLAISLAAGLTSHMNRTGIPSSVIYYSPLFPAFDKCLRGNLSNEELRCDLGWRCSGL